MMAQNDGSIIISTKLDNTGFERGSKKMQQSIKGILKGFMGAGTSAGKGVGAITSTFQKAEQSMYRQLTDSVSSDGFTKQIAPAERAVSSLEKQLQRLSESERIGVKTGTQMTRFQIKVENARKSVEQLEQEMEKLGGQQIRTASTESLYESYWKANNEADKLRAKQQSLSDAGVKKSSAAWQKLTHQIEAASQKALQANIALENKHASGMMFSSGSGTEQYQQMAATLRDMQGQLQRYEAMAANFDTVSNPAERSEASLKKVDKELRQKPKDAGKASSAFSFFGRVLKGAASTALKASANIAKIGFKGVTAGAKKAASSISKFFSRTKDGTMTANGLAKALTSIRRMLVSRIKEKMITLMMQSMRQAMTALAQYSSAFNESMSSMKNAATGLGGNLAVTFGNLVNAVAPAITTIINWISKAISYLNAFFAMLSGKSFVTVAKKQTDDYAGSLGGAAGAAKDLKKEVYGFDELNKASSDDGGGGGGGGGAGDMFEDVPIASLLPESVSNFFNSIKAAFEAGDWQGIGVIIGNGLNVAVTAVDDWITSIQPVAVEWSSRIAQILNGLVMGFDWANLGSTVANGINTIFAIINTFLTTFDWTALGTALGTGFNSLFNDLDWALIGQTFANKWNALINTIYGFVTAVNWSGLGTSIATGVANWFNTINWSGIVGSINASVTGVFNSITAFMQGIDWASAGQTIGGIVNGLDIAGMITSITTSLNTFVTSAFTLASNILSSVDWASLGASFAGIVEGLDLAAWVGSWTEFITTFWADAFSFATGFITAIDWTELGDTLWNSLVAYFESFDWNGLIGNMFEFLGAAIGGASALIVSLAGNIWEALKSAWESVETYFGDYFDQFGGDIVAGLLAGIGNAILGIGQWIVDNIFTPFINGFKAAFGIASPSTVMQEMGGFIIEGLLNGLTTAWATIVEWVTGIVEDFAAYFSGLWDTISTAASTAWEDISTTITGAWDNLTAAATTAWDGIKTTITGVWDGLKTGATQAWDGIKTTITTTWDNLSTSATTTWNNIKTSISTVWTNLSTSATTTWNNIKTNLSTTWDGVKTTASTAWEGIKTTIIDWFTGTRDDAKAVDWSGVGQGITTGTESGITGLWSSFKTRVVNKFKNLVQSVKTTLGIASPSKVFKSIGGYTMMGLNEGIEGKEGTVFRTMSNIANGLSETITGSPEVEVTSARVVSGMDAVADKLSNIATTFAAIANVLTAVGGFSAPSIASGTAIPYKARVAAETPHTGNSDPLTALDFDETMSDQKDVLREILETVRNLNLSLVIDEDSLEKRITHLQRNRQRAYGY